MVLRDRVARPGTGAIEPCLPSPAKRPPAGPGWIHEIKHDGFRLIARRDSAGVRLITRKGNDFTSRFPSIAMAVANLPARSCVIDGEAIVCDESGLAVFELIRRQRTSTEAVHCAFDLLELDGEDLRSMPIEARKRTLESLLRHAHSSIVFNRHFGGRRRDGLPRGLRAWLRGHRIEAARLAIQVRPVGTLGEGQESSGAGGTPGGRGGLGM